MAEPEPTRAPRSHTGAPSTYVAVWIALVVLTFATYLIAKIDLGEWNLLVAMLIAATKSALVLMFFMHLWYETGVNRLIPFLALCFVALLCALTALDVHTRFPLAAPPGSLRALVPPDNQLD